MTFSLSLREAMKTIKEHVKNMMQKWEDNSRTWEHRSTKWLMRQHKISLIKTSARIAHKYSLNIYSKNEISVNWFKQTVMWASFYRGEFLKITQLPFKKSYYLSTKSFPCVGEKDSITRKVQVDLINYTLTLWSVHI